MKDFLLVHKELIDHIQMMMQKLNNQVPVAKLRRENTLKPVQ